MPPESVGVIATAFASLRNVAEERLTPEMVERVIALIETEIRDHFGPKYPGGQRAIAVLMHVAQPTLNRLLKKREGVGLDVCLALRAYLAESGRPMTIDQMLGLTPAAATETPEAVRSMAALTERFIKLEAEVRALQTRRDLKEAEKHRALIAVEKAKHAAVGNRDARAHKSRRKTA
jgi:plasmid maintenance system antidote protein VapI